MHCTTPARCVPRCTPCAPIPVRGRAVRRSRRCVQQCASRKDASLPATTPPSLSRRHLLGAAGTGFLLPVGWSLPSWAAVPAFDGPKLLADLPMIRLKLPKGGVGGDYAAVQMTVAGQGPYRFMVDSGLTAELITPHLQEELRIPSGNNKVSGLGAGGLSAPAALVQLKDAALVSGSQTLRLPPLNAAVMDFPQAHLDSAGEPVEGMLGMEVLSLFDADLDFPKGRIRLWAPGSAAKVAESEGLIELPAAVLNETGIIGIRATAAPGALNTKPSEQPFVGIIDCGASLTTINLKAAQLMGLPAVPIPGGKGVQLQLDKSAQGPPVLALGVDGKPQALPTTMLSFTYKGNARKDQDGRMTFDPPAQGWKPWKPVLAAIGELPAFSQLLGDGRTPFNGPAALIGLDVLSQRRVILEAGPRGVGRQRRLFMTRG